MTDLAFVHKWIDNGGQRTLLLLHGTGGDENDLIGLGETLDPKANYLSLRGNSHEEGANRFFRRVSSGVFDEEDLKARTTELYDFLQAAGSRHVFSQANTVAVGYSNGANIAASLLMMYPASIGGAVLVRAMAPFRKTIESKLPNSPVLLLSGNRDPIVSVQQKQQLVDQLSAVNCRVEAHDINAGHELTRKDVELATQWLSTLDK